MTGGSYNCYSLRATAAAAARATVRYGQFRHNDIGSRTPRDGYPIHDSTDQWHALAKATHIIDDNSGSPHPAAPRRASRSRRSRAWRPTSLCSGKNGHQQRRPRPAPVLENNYFAILSLQKHYGEADFQLSAWPLFRLFYQPIRWAT